jgi:hypothetical protein
MVAFPAISALACASTAATLLLGCAIAVLTLAPVDGPDVPGSDKHYHFLAFAALAFSQPFARPGLVVPVVIGATCYGGFIELIQPSFGRTAEWSDLLADGLGAIAGAVAGGASGAWFQRVGLKRKAESR